MPARDMSNLLPRKRKKLFSVKPFKIRKVEAIGNQIRDIPCPSPRSGHRIVYGNGNIYSFGGYNPTTINNHVVHKLYSELLVFNCASKTWRVLETTGNIPEELASHSAVYFQNQLFVFGGTAYPFGEKISNDVHICNLETLHWSKVEASGSPPSPQYGQAVAVCKSKMYSVGGTTGFIYFNEVHCFDLLTKEWKQLSKKTEENEVYKPEPRYRHEIAVYDNKIFVFGGSSNVNFTLEELPLFDLQSNTWSKVSTTGSCPSPRRAHACVQSEYEVFLTGGFDGDAHSYKSIHKINLLTLRWEELPVSLPYPLHFHSAALTHTNQMYIFGGMNGEKNKRTNDLHSVWIKMPSLEAMCWEAVLHYAPQIPLLEKRNLFEMGIPVYYLNQVEHYSLSNFDTLSNSSNGDPFEICDLDASDIDENVELSGEEISDEDLEAGILDGGLEAEISDEDLDDEMLENDLEGEIIEDDLEGEIIDHDLEGEIIDHDLEGDIIDDYLEAEYSDEDWEDL